MELFNITIDSLEKDVVKTIFHSQKYEDAKKVKASLIHWIPKNMDMKCQVVLPNASIINGSAEEGCRQLQADTIVQFERFGFVRIDSNKDDLITAYYCHH